MQHARLSSGVNNDLTYTTERQPMLRQIHTACVVGRRKQAGRARKIQSAINESGIVSSREPSDTLAKFTTGGHNM